jgi:hypothetical protein
MNAKNLRLLVYMQRSEINRRDAENAGQINNACRFTSIAQTEWNNAVYVFS